MDVREQCCCFTGHRKLPREQLPAIKRHLNAAVISLIHSGVRYFGAGGALGFDTLAARTVLELREEYPGIQLILVLPCADQSSRWGEADIRIYEEIKARADRAVCLAERYYRGCMHRRNRYLVEHSAHCICYLTQDSGGTAYTVGCARDSGLAVMNIAAEVGEEIL